MNKLYDIVRLVMTSTLSDRDIARSLHVAKNTVRRYRNLTAACGQHWDALAAMEPQALERTFNRRPHTLTQKRQPDFAHIHEDRRRYRSVGGGAGFGGRASRTGASVHAGD